MNNLRECYSQQKGGYKLKCISGRTLFWFFTKTQDWIFVKMNLHQFLPEIIKVMKKGSHQESYHNLHLTQGGLTQRSLPPLPICAPQQLCSSRLFPHISIKLLL